MKKPSIEEALKRLERITPERRRIAKIFSDNIENAIYQIGLGYTVGVQGDYDTTPIRIRIEISSINGEMP